MNRLAFPFLIAALLAGSACQRKSEAQVAAEESARLAEAKVAELQQRLDQAKGVKPAGSDAEVHEHLGKGQVKALERQLSDAKRRAEAKKKEAEAIAKAPAPPEAPKPLLVEVPAGTRLEVSLARELNTGQAHAGDPFEGVLAEPVVAGGRTVWPAGSPVRGVVTQSVPASRLASGKGVLAVKLTEVGGEGIETDTFSVSGGATGERNAKFIGGGAALGALVGILSDRKNQGDHALGGAAVGAAVGTAAAAATADTVIRIKADARLAFTLSAPEKVLVKP
ncbi:MAG: hypothetical protein HY823_10825 [Acidobacteria bacterium]|nr:hypothetical protein [Acidobacteriota bacterium]